MVREWRQRDSGSFEASKRRQDGDFHHRNADTLFVDNLSREMTRDWLL